MRSCVATPAANTRSPPEPPPLARYLECLADRQPEIKGVSLDGIRHSSMSLTEDFPCDCAQCQAGTLLLTSAAMAAISFCV